MANGAGPGPGRVGGKFLGYFKQLAQSLDLDPVALLKAVGIDKSHLEDTKLTLPGHKIGELVESAAASSGIEDFGLRLAEVCGMPDLGPAGILMREEPTVREALQAMIDLGRLMAESNASLTYLEDGENPVFRTDIILKDAASFRHTMDMGMAFNVCILRSLLGQDWVPVAVCFTHARPRPRKRFERFFRCPVHFDHEFNGIVLRRSDLDTKMPPLSSVLRWQMDRFLQAIDIVPGDVFVHRATRVIAIALPRGQAKAQKIARSLGVERRTLNRRLASAGLNYSVLLESVRKNLAVQHLLGGNRPLLDIAGILGFSSLSVFTRWFHKAFERAPRAWRNAHRASHSNV